MIRLNYRRKKPATSLQQNLQLIKNLQLQNGCSITIGGVTGKENVQAKKTLHVFLQVLASSKRGKGERGRRRLPRRYVFRPSAGNTSAKTPISTPYTPLGVDWMLVWREDLKIILKAFLEGISLDITCGKKELVTIILESRADLAGKVTDEIMA